MIILITGLTGSGKTWFMSRLLYKRWKQGENVHANFSLTFPNADERVSRWHNLGEIYDITNGVIGIDEAQKLFNSRAWMFLPVEFADKIASHRHQFLDIISTAQDLGHIDNKYRDNIHELYNCQSLWRFPKSDRVHPIFQVIKIIRKQRNFNDLTGIRWVKSGSKIRFISKFWTKELYNTYANIDLSHFVCQIKRENKKWLIILQSRQLMNRRKLHQ